MKATTTKNQAKKISKSYLPPSKASQELVPVATSNMLGIAANVVGVITTAINNPKFDVKKMQAVLDAQMQVIRYQAEVSFSQAMVACQAALPQIPANCENKHTHSKYANLEAIDKIIRPIIAQHGFSLNFDTEQVGDRHIKVICTVRHVDGHKEPFSMVGELDDGGFKGTANKTGIQAAGSSASYLVRYLVKQIFHVVIIGEDKDGNKTTEKKPEGEAFTSRVHQDAGVIIEGDVRPVAPGHVITGHQLKSDLLKLKTKKQRREHINKNLATLHALDKAGDQDMVQQLHNLADQGA